MKLSRIHPVFYHLRVAQKRLGRQLSDRFGGTRFARQQADTTKYTYSCKKHQSLLRRKLGQSDPRLQENKIMNLQLAIPALDGLLIQPGETFSFWQRVGKTTAEKGYVEGLLLSQGEVTTGIGGGLCQLANLLFWMALHTPLEITERHHHQFDPFPDDQRVLPFGSGASVFYNYVDLRFHNPTQQTFQLRVWLTDKHLKGAIFSDQLWPFSYHLEERNHQFLQQAAKNYRRNEIWRLVYDKQTGNRISEELMIRNFSEVKYNLDDLPPILHG
ncbi:VanW family protein [Brevibacillus ruminantium]|uniref:VanW family protein n=1 Tax=Brevibacillus ruminantium TaxID=2950604 RepID=A0ABY4WEH0_9BACL|nr:VanW family protein [Brevibacillus ruminantium]USG65289.1 VanW family protein [Brevibacillus ruminantium]